jgi:hypothetical protein
MRYCMCTVFSVDLEIFRRILFIDVSSLVQSSASIKRQAAHTLSFSFASLGIFTHLKPTRIEPIGKGISYVSLDSFVDVARSISIDLRRARRCCRWFATVVHRYIRQSIDRSISNDVCHRRMIIRRTTTLAESYTNILMFTHVTEQIVMKYCREEIQREGIVNEVIID